jgi:hypothetical protein
MRGSTRPRRSALRVAKAAAALAMPGTACELYSEPFSHEIRTMECRHNIAGIHWVLVLDEPEAVHELYFGNFSSAMSREVSLDVGLGSCWAAGQWFE